MSTQLIELLNGGIATLERTTDRDGFASSVMDAADERGVEIDRGELDAFLDEAFNPGTSMTDDDLAVVASGCTCAFCTCSYMVITR